MANAETKEPPLRWHWQGDRRTHDNCGGLILFFKEGMICDKCKEQGDYEGAIDPAPPWLGEE